MSIRSERIAVKSAPPDGFNAHRIDTKLIAAVERRSAARCQKGVNLIYAYTMAAGLYEENLARDDQALKRQLLDGVQRAEADLRTFPWECRR